MTETDVLRRRPGGRAGPEKRRPLWVEIPLLVVVALCLALLIRTFLVQAFSIPSESMRNTLQEGDRVLVMVPEDEVVGRAVVVTRPVGRWATLPIPAAFSLPGIESAAVPGGLALAGALPLLAVRRRRKARGTVSPQTE